MAGPQYVFHMQGLTKAYPGGKKVFENIHLSFLPSAKIGVVGVNGSGKSTLLRIMAGVDKDFVGEAWPAEGVKVGYLPQEPKLDPTKNVFENIAATCPEKIMVDQFNEISMKLGEDYSDELMEEMTKLQEQYRRCRCLGYRLQDRNGDGTPCAARKTTPTSPPSRAARSAASPSASCSCRSQT